MLKRPVLILCSLVLLVDLAMAKDVPGSQDPRGVRRYEGSEIIGYHAPRFDVFTLPIPTTSKTTNKDEDWKVEGLVSRRIYVIPAGRSALEVLGNYKQEFQRLGLKTIYEKKPDYQPFNYVFEHLSKNDLGNDKFVHGQADEECLVIAKTMDPSPAYYVVYVAPDDVYRQPGAVIQKGQVFAYVIEIAPKMMEERMVQIHAADMAQSIRDSGKVALYGIYFDTDKDTLRDDSKPTLAEIVKLLNNNPGLSLHVVGHTDNQGNSAYNLDLSSRRAKAVVRALKGMQVAERRLDAFGCGLYAPIASNTDDAGRAKNRRVELVSW